MSRVDNKGWFKKGWRFFLAAGLVLGLASVPTGAAAAAPAGGEVTLTVNTFGGFGYEELYQEYMKTHPNVTIKEQIAKFQDHHDALQAHLLAGSGTADIEAVETGQIAQFMSQADKFVDFKPQGVNPKQWLDWKSAQVTTPDGKYIGLGTDIGGLAMAYRVDLFKAAGLPTDPNEVAKLWPTWEGYIEAGKRFQANAPAGSHWFDNGSTMMNAVMGQAGKAFYEKDGTLIVKTNPEVKNAWNLSIQAVQANESAKLPGWSPQWQAGFKQSAFATIPAPAWMLDTIGDPKAGFAPETTEAGLWNVTTVPGGVGNWGGSFLTIPKQGQHVKEAVELAKWLTDPVQQERVFTSHGHLPSTVAALNSKAVLTKTDARYNNAPVGQIYAASALSLKPQYMGPKHSQIANTLGEGIARVEQGKEKKPDQAWAHSMKDIDKLTGTYKGDGLNPLWVVGGLVLVGGVVVFIVVRRRKNRS